MKEFQQLQTSKPHGISVSVPSDSMYIWEAVFAAPQQSLYSGTYDAVALVTEHLLDNLKNGGNEQQS